MIPGSARNVYTYTVPQWFVPVMGENFVESFFCYKSMADGCGCLEVWRDFFQYFPQECGSRHTLELTEGLGYWVSPVYIYIPFDMLGAIYWLTQTSIDTVQN